MKNTARVLLWIVGAFLLAACATTSLQSAWYDTSYRGGPFRKILVVGVGANLTDRRVFEDIFAQQLNTAGTQGIPGYQFLPDDARQNEPGWNEGVTRSGADGLLLVRVLGVDTKTQVVTTMVPGPIYFGPYGRPWGPQMIAVPEVTQYDVATVETNLYDVKTKRVVWSGTTQTFNPSSVAKETPGFAKIIIGQLAARGLIAGAK
ncbi:MAG TPA: hypothetical protein VJ032_10290 [Thermoanaerobaculia bacterium]|nr:hypothetical protein [Thermoanaerobaculia bacterium]